MIIRERRARTLTFCGGCCTPGGPGGRRIAAAGRPSLDDLLDTCVCVNHCLHRFLTEVAQTVFLPD